MKKASQGMSMILLTGMIFSVFSQIQVATILGTVLDTTTGKPIEKATVVLFPSSLGIIAPETTYTNTDGKFIKDIKFPPLPEKKVIYYTIYKKGYTPKKGLKDVEAQIVDVGNIKLAQVVTVTVIGTVLDSITLKPVPDASVVLKSNDTVSVITNETGLFKAVIDVDPSQTNPVIQYAVNKKGYAIKIGEKKIDGNPVDLGNILLSRKLSPQKITVTGTVMDTGTGKPVSGAMILLTTNLQPSGIVDTTYSDEKGNFAKVIQPGIIGVVPPVPVVTYVVMKERYVPKKGQQEIAGQLVDLGKIFLLEIQTEIQLPVSTPVLKAPDNIQVFSLNGQLLYAGPMLSVKMLSGKGVIHGNPVIVSFRVNNTSLYSRKIVGAR